MCRRCLCSDWGVGMLGSGGKKVWGGQLSTAQGGKFLGFRIGEVLGWPAPGSFVMIHLNEL